ncbi:hypothetical protein ACROYT_G015324 [Oculina patagonica]
MIWLHKVCYHSLLSTKQENWICVKCDQSRINNSMHKIVCAQLTVGHDCHHILCQAIRTGPWYIAEADYLRFCCKEASSILELCLKKVFCNPNVKSTEGLTPLHVAALWGRFYNLKILLDNGGDVQETDEDGSNALDFAQEASCIRLLLEAESSAEQVQHATCKESEPNGLSTVTVQDSESDFSESFYTAIEDDSVLDRTVVTFPKLHPWHADPSKTFDLDDTVVDKFNNLSISSYRDVIKGTTGLLVLSYSHTNGGDEEAFLLAYMF